MLSRRERLFDVAEAGLAVDDVGGGNLHHKVGVYLLDRLLPDDIEVCYPLHVPRPVEDRGVDPVGVEEGSLDVGDGYDLEVEADPPQQLPLPPHHFQNAVAYYPEPHQRYPHLSHIFSASIGSITRRSFSAPTWRRMERDFAISSFPVALILR